ncbi:peptidyl-prolyl cis-trans isomerase [Anaeromyxobacter sp. PSR-1]|uniref:peptidylprolyl isomerase n=1 Tax=unclassified Anaeromyxobacter TaxID=2620896 RepID=UPI0005E0363C|nr:peptidyl-prolyl cis-trans isomerase [Anaeromyxobacter sp. PSR-1]GAO01788.1 foldase protein PrsA [Anaeromyxobacter sp. PSR-1]
MRPALAPILIATALAAGCGRCGGARSGERPAPGAVAVVNGEPIAPDAVARELRDAQAGAEGQAPATGDVLRRRVLDDLVDRALLLQQARARSIVVGQDQVERAFLRLRAEYPGTHFDDLLAQERLSQAELKARLKDQLTVERLFEQEVFPQVQVVDAEVERYYAEHGPEFQEPERVHVLQIVVASREEAAQVREKLRRNPQTFAEVARRSSIAPEGKGGGDLGFIGRGSGFPEVFDTCFSLPVNVISDVTPSPYGFHLFKVVEKKPAQRRTLEQARAEIAEKLGREKRAGAQAEYLEALRKRAQIEIDEKALAAVTP